MATLPGLASSLTRLQDGTLGSKKPRDMCIAPETIIVRVPYGCWALTYNYFVASLRYCTCLGQQDVASCLEEGINIDLGEGHFDIVASLQGLATECFHCDSQAASLRCLVRLAPSPVQNSALPREHFQGNPEIH